MKHPLISLTKTVIQSLPAGQAGLHAEGAAKNHAAPKKIVHSTCLTGKGRLFLATLV